MINITDKIQCCGCNACGDICAHKAIAFKTGDMYLFHVTSDDMEVVL